MSETEGNFKLFDATYLNMIADLSFMNSVTGSGFVAKCSNILQDNSKYSKILGIFHFHQEK